MNPRFRKALDSLQPKYERLIASPAHVRGPKLPAKGIYIFSEKGAVLYVGRSDNIRRRFNEQRRSSSGTNSAGFAVLLAQDELGLRFNYRAGANSVS